MKISISSHLADLKPIGILSNGRHRIGNKEWIQARSASVHAENHFIISPMKMLKAISLRSRTVGVIFALTVTGPALFANNAEKSDEKTSAPFATAEKSESEISGPHPFTEEQSKAALAQIDADLEHLNQLAGAAPDPSAKSEVKSSYSTLRERRNVLEKDFTRSRYESFKADLQKEKEKVSNWTSDTSKSKTDNSAALATGDTTAVKAAEKIADYRAEASDPNKAEAKAALARLDADIYLLNAKIDTITDEARKAELKQKLKGLKDRRGELNNEFRKARYDSLMDDVQTEWNKAIAIP